MRAWAILGHGATAEALVNIRDRLGLDRPFWVRYFEWLEHLVTGDLGQSLAS